MHVMHHLVKPLDASGAFAAGMHSMHNVGMNLQRIRKAKGLNQRELADLVGLDQSTIQRAEAMHESAKLTTYKACAEALGVTLADIFSEDRTAAEIALINSFRRAPEEKRKGLFDLLRLFETEGH